MVPSLLHLSMKSVLRNKLPHDQLPRSIQDRLKRLRVSNPYIHVIDKDFDSLHYTLDCAKSSDLQHDNIWVYRCAKNRFFEGLKLCLRYKCPCTLVSMSVMFQNDDVDMVRVVLEDIIDGSLDTMDDMDHTMVSTITLPLVFKSKTTSCLKFIYSILPKKYHPNTVRYTMMMAQHGNIEGLRFLCDNGCPINIEATRAALENGSVECFKYVSEQHPLHITKDDMIKALWRNHHAMFKHLHSMGNGMFIEFWDAVIKRDISYDMVEYLIEHRCPWNEEVIANAAYIGNIIILRRLHEVGCPWDEKVLSATTTWMDKKTHLECFKYALKEGAPLSPKILYHAAMYNTLPILKAAIEAGCPLPPEDLVYTAARCGSLSCLKYLHKTNEITNKHLQATVTFGHVKCLRYILEHTDLYIDMTMEYSLNDVKCYEYLRQRAADDPNVYQIDPTRVMNGAAINGRMKLVKHLRKNGVKWPPGLLMDVFEDGPFYMLNYMLANGASRKHLDMGRMLHCLSMNVVDNELIDEDQSGDNRRKLRLIGTLFGLGPRERGT